MTTPPKARRYNVSLPGDGDTAQAGPDQPAETSAEQAPTIRIERRKRTDPAQEGQPPDGDGQELTGSVPYDDGFGDQRFPGAADSANQTSEPANPPTDDPGLEAKLAAIRAEKLTARQLRVARRIATLHQIQVASDEEAVLRLRERGIDPSHRAAVSKALSEEGEKARATPSPNAPVPMRQPAPPARSTEIGRIDPAKAKMPSREAMTEEKRAAEIMRIQREMARRRRRRLAFLFMRLAFFVFLPTGIASWYYYNVATPLYSTDSQFLIQQADAGGSSGGGMGLAAMMANTDSVSVQSYLTSRDAMLRLDGDLGFKRAFEDPSIDPILRLPADASNEAAYGIYKKSVKIGYDPTEGVINMEVIAPDPQLSQDISLALIDYAEGQVDQLSARLREDQMRGAIDNYADAEQKVLDSQARVQELQEQMGILDVQAESGIAMAQIGRLEQQLTEKELALASYLDNPRPNQTRVQTTRAEIARLEEMLTNARLQLTTNSDGRHSLAAITGQLLIAENDLKTRQSLLSAAAENMELARIEANKQVRYLSLSVSPIPPDEPTYPKAFQNSLVAFLIFSGIYLMLSLTASILREQVSS